MRLKSGKKLRTASHNSKFIDFYKKKEGKCQRWSRGHKARGQGQGHKKIPKPRPRPRTAFPRTEPLKAKDRNARGQGQGPRTQAQVFSKKKKKVFKNFFRRSPFIDVPRIFDWSKPSTLNCRGDASPHRDLASSQ